MQNGVKIPNRADFPPGIIFLNFYTKGEAYSYRYIQAHHQLPRRKRLPRLKKFFRLILNAETILNFEIQTNYQNRVNERDPWARTQQALSTTYFAPFSELIIMQ